MKVITKVVLSIRTGEVKECEWFEYSGPIAECKGGGGVTTSTTTTTGEIDYEYNQRMATIAEAQQAIADEYARFWESDYKPLESAQIAANLSLVPYQTALAKEETQAARGLIPAKYSAEYAQQQLAGAEADVARSLVGVKGTTERARNYLEQEQIYQQRGLLPEATQTERERMLTERGELAAQRELRPGKTALAQEEIGFERARIGLGQREMTAAEPVMAEYYKQALQGQDIGQAVSRARADVAAGFKGAESAERRAMGRLGILGQTRTSGALRQRFAEQAKATAFASTAAKRGAEEQNFQRLGQAVTQFRGGVGGPK